jgi:hypothetical protein
MGPERARHPGSSAKVNEFGDQVAGGKPSPQVTLDCSLKLIKERAG